MLVIVLFLLALVVTGLLAERFGADSRPRADERPEHWIAAPR